MGILDRFTTIVKANVNDMLDKAEDPAKMVDQHIVEMTEALADVKREAAAVIAEEKRCARELEGVKADIERMARCAKNALKAGNEGDARMFVTEKQELEAKRTELESAYVAAKANADKMREMHDKLVHDINELKSRRQVIKSKVAVAKAQQKVAGYTSASNKAENALEAFDRMEAKADAMLDQSTALEELGHDADDDLEAKARAYDGGVSDTSVDDELAKLKAELDAE